MYKFLSTVLLFFPLLALGLPAHGQLLSGAANLSYGSYDAEESGQKVVDAHHFTQQYSLLYQMDGQIKEGRGGEFALGLGYEWNSLAGSVLDRNSNIDQETDVRTGKILYRGEFLLAPGGLPFRLHGFSRDLNRSQFVTGRLLPRSGDDDLIRADNILDPRIYDDISNGQHTLTGVTLEVGIRNGSYLGSYRDILSMFPRLLVDYRELYVRDLRANQPRHDRDRNLAFISLNKKDNWFHYRFHDYTDYTDHRNDFQEKTYLLGTIDHQRVRHYINLTNWLKVSGDGSFTRSDYQLNEQRSQQRYDLNLQAIARRNNWSGSTFSSYQRIRDIDSLDQTLEVPVYAEGTFNRQSAWRYQLIGFRDRTEQTLPRPLLLRDDDLYTAYRLETNRQQRFIVAPKIEAEVRGGDRGQGQAARFGLECYSNSAYKPVTTLFGGFSLAYLDGQAGSGTEVSYVEGVLNGRLQTRLSPDWSTGFEERLILGQGDLGSGVTSHITPLGQLGLVASYDGYADRAGTTFRSTSTWFAELVTRGRLRNRLELIYDYLSTQGVRNSQFLARQRLDYDSQKWRVNMRNEYVIGDDVASGIHAAPLVATDSNAVINARESYLHDTRVRYYLNRNWEARAGLSYNWRSNSSGEDMTRTLAFQQVRYNFFVVNGMVRKLADITEELQYEEIAASSTATTSATIFSLSCNYYPTHHLFLGAKVRFRSFEPESQDEFSYFLLAGMNFQKLSIDLDYAYGDRSAGDGGLPERVEHRFQASVRKTF